MRKIFLFAVIWLLVLSCKENTKKTIHFSESMSESNELKKTSDTISLFIDSTLVRKHLYAIASDEMQGRKAGTPGIEKAAQYIENEFKRMGLSTFDTLSSYRQTFTFKPRGSNDSITSSNIIGVLDGQSKKNEYVIISAHYDHIGINQKQGVLDSIYNGANDDASGVTGVLALAEHFKKVGNERTLVFVAFTAEEMGIIGSKYFGKRIDASKFVAGLNLEMIGKTPSFGPNAAWLTGFDRSNLGRIIQKNLKGTGYQLYPDPYKKFNLFYRSDNASLARLGVPSHTFSTTAIDTDQDYHQSSDEASTLDINVITQTIQAIAVGAKSIISGEDTPTRIVLE